jgi:hypothetical protein
LLENNELVEVQRKKDLNFLKIVKELIEFYHKNPTHNKFEKIVDSFNKSLDVIKENESKLKHLNRRKTVR